MPDSIRIIGESGFRECRKLSRAKLSNTLCEIGAYAFKDCDALENVVMPGEMRYPDGTSGMLGIGCFEGCGLLRETSYVVVVPHDEDYQVSVDSDVLVVSSYLSLKNAILSMVQDCRDEGVIRAEHYTGELSEDLSQAVNEVTQMSPVGAGDISNKASMSDFINLHLHGPLNPYSTSG